MTYDLIAKAYKKLLTESTEHPMIEVDGVMRHRTNSLGQPIHHTDEGIKNFHRWFGDSKAVDEHGRPQVFYHSSLADKEQFDPHGKFMGYTGTSGISVTDNPVMASRYLDRYSESGWVDGKPNQSFNKNILPVYIKMLNPLHRDEPFKTNIILGAPLPKDYISPVVKMGHDALIRDDAISLRGSVKHSLAKNAIKGKELVIFNPANIKSAIGNSGAFSHPTKITESKLDSIAKAYLNQINESFDAISTFKSDIDPNRYDVISSTRPDYNPDQVDIQYAPKVSKTAVPYEYYTKRKKGSHWYEPELSTLEKRDEGEVFERQIPVLKPEYSRDINTDRTKNLIYRGISEEEYQNIAKTGKIKSHGDFNMTGQEGLTYFSTDPDAAQNYAHNFAPLNHKATGIHHAYVIGIENPGTGVKIAGTGEHEVGIPGEIDANQIKEVHRGRAYTISSGEQSYIKDYSGKIRQGSSFAPTVHLAWEKIK